MALETDIDVLSAQPLLGLLPREALRLVAFAAETRILRAGDILFRKGEAADGAYLVISGIVALDTRDDGSPTVHTAGIGHLIGETALFAPTSRPATALARETTTVMKLARTVMMRVLGEFPDAAISVHSAVSARVLEMARDMSGVRDRITAIDR